MKDTLSLKITRELLKIFKLKDKNKLLKINRKNFDKWDSLTHLQIIFLLEKNIKKKISIEKLNKVSSVKEINKILDEN
tara:strand:+ start:814 stop:1047 length:234 start_codon:yes stop_codon:yes gene_type:complete